MQFPNQVSKIIHRSAKKFDVISLEDPLIVLNASNDLEYLIFDWPAYSNDNEFTDINCCTYSKTVQVGFLLTAQGAS